MRNFVTKIKALVIFVMALIVGLSFLISSPLRLPFKSFLVTSGSMRPRIPEGSVVIVKRGNNNLHVGDAITFIKPDNPQQNVTHRITAIESVNHRPQYRTKGDANNTPDAWLVRREAIWGKAIITIPLLGFLIDFSGTKLGSVMVYVIPTILIIFSEIRDIVTELRRSRSRQLDPPKLPLLLIATSLFVPSLVSRSTATFAFQSISQGNQISSTCWAPPDIPQLTSLGDGTLLNAGSTWYSTPLLDWTDTVSLCPSATVSYELEIFSDSGLTSSLFTTSGLISSQITLSSVADGPHYWRVRACDDSARCSSWSTTNYYLVDRLAPTASFTSPHDLDYVSGLVGIRGSASDLHLAHYSLTVTNSSDVIVQSVSLDETSSFDNRLLMSWDTSSLPDGVYRLRLQVTDTSGNSTSSEISVTNTNVLPTTSLTDSDATFNTRSVTLNFQVDSGLTDYISICYDRNLSDNWECPDLARSYSYPTGTFSLNLPEDGLYRFYSLGHNPLYTEPSLGKPYVTYQIDSTPPTTMLGPSSATTTYTGQNLLTNIWDSFGTGDHHLTSFGYQIGFTDVAGSGTDGIYQIVSIPSHLSTSLSFAFRSFSNDSVDFARLSVIASSLTSPEELTILATGANESVPSSWTSDSGWRYYSRSLLGLAGQTIRISFTQTNADTSQASFSYIDSVRLTTLDTRVGETEAYDPSSHDVGSGVLANNPPATTVVGENVITLGVTDVATNPEINHTVSVVTLPPLVLNRILFRSDQVELYNNSSTAVDLSTYTLDCGTTLFTLTGTHAANTTSLVSCPLDDNTATVSLNSGVSQVDSTTYFSQGDLSEIWSRTVTGIGPWSLSAAALDFNLISRPTVNKVTLSVSNITSSTDYSIIYSNSIGLQEIAGNIPLAGLTSGRADRDFYLGSCSANGTCTPDVVSLGSTIAVTVNSVTKTFIY